MCRWHPESTRVCCCPTHTCICWCTACQVSCKNCHSQLSPGWWQAVAKHKPEGNKYHQLTHSKWNLAKQSNYTSLALITLQLAEEYNITVLSKTQGQGGGGGRGGPWTLLSASSLAPNVHEKKIIIFKVTVLVMLASTMYYSFVLYILALRIFILRCYQVRPHSFLCAALMSPQRTKQYCPQIEYVL